MTQKQRTYCLSLIQTAVNKHKMDLQLAYNKAEPKEVCPDKLVQMINSGKIKVKVTKPDVCNRYDRKRGFGYLVDYLHPNPYTERDEIIKELTARKNNIETYVESEAQGLRRLVMLGDPTDADKLIAVFEKKNFAANLLLLKVKESGGGE